MHSCCDIWCSTVPCFYVACSASACTALDSSGQLVGVAGIDVQINGLNQQLYSDIGTSLDDESRQVTLASPDGADLNCKACLHSLTDSILPAEALAHTCTTVSS